MRTLELCPEQVFDHQFFLAASSCKNNQISAKNTFECWRFCCVCEMFFFQCSDLAILPQFALIKRPCIHLSDFVHTVYRCNFVKHYTVCDSELFRTPYHYFAHLRGRLKIGHFYSTTTVEPPPCFQLAENMIWGEFCKVKKTAFGGSESLSHECEN